MAEEGWRLLPYYRFEPATGLWRHRKPAAEPPLSLHDVSYASGTMEYRHVEHRAFHSDDVLTSYLEEAHHILTNAASTPGPPTSPPNVTADFEHLRWFPLPNEIG